MLQRTRRVGKTRVKTQPKPPFPPQHQRRPGLEADAWARTAHQDPAEAVAAEGRKILLLPWDVRSSAFCRRAVEKTVARFGHLRRNDRRLTEELGTGFALLVSTE